MEKVDDAAVNAVMGNFSLQAVMPGDKTFSVSGYLFSGESVESLNARVDLLHDVIDRQRTRTEIPKLEAIRDQQIRQLDQMREHMAGLDARVSGGGKALTSQEKLALKNISESLGKVQADIDKGAEAIAEAKAKTGMK